MKKKSLFRKGLEKVLSAKPRKKLQAQYAAWPNTPRPLAEWAALRAEIAKSYPYEHPLSLHYVPEAVSAELIEVPELRENLAGRTIGAWALDVDSIHFYWAELLRLRPEIIIECGSGTSTIMAATYFKKEGINGKLISLEQSEEEKASIEATLQKLNLADYVSVYYVPVGADQNYDFSKFKPNMPQKADLILIDGPRGSRLNTLPNLKTFAKSGARWFLDDALRDSEQAYLQAWSKENGVDVEGVIPLGKGFGTGSIL